jgi:hypothetical protein
LSADTVVRAAIGWEVEGRFTPFVLASDLGVSLRSSRSSGQFRPHPLVGAAPPDAERRALEHLSRRA